MAGRITKDNDGGFILNLDGHRQLYKASYEGNLFVCKRGKMLDGWNPIEGGATLRRVIWQRFRYYGVFLPWVEENGVKMQIKGFWSFWNAINDQLRAAWICDLCDSIYEDSPCEVDYLATHGCRNAACPSYIERMKQLESLTDEDRES